MANHTTDALARCLADLGVILANKSYLGGADAEKAYLLHRRVKQRLEIEDAAKLVLEADSFARIYLEQISKSRAGLQQRELEKEAASVADGEHRRNDLERRMAAENARRLARAIAQEQLG